VASCPSRALSTSYFSRRSTRSTSVRMASSSSTTRTGFFDNQRPPPAERATLLPISGRRMQGAGRRWCSCSPAPGPLRSAPSLEPRAAVDVDRHAVEIVGHRRSEEENDGGDVADRSDAAQRDLPDDLVVVRVELALGHLGGDEAGGDAAGHDVVLRAAAGDGAGEVDERGLGGAVVGEL